MKEPSQPHDTLIHTSVSPKPSLPPTAVIRMNTQDSLATHLSQIKSIREHLGACLQSVVSVRVLLSSRKTVDRCCLPVVSVPGVSGAEAVAAGPARPRPPRNQSCLSEHILLPNFLCFVAQASRCVLSVPLPKLAYNRTVAAHPLLPYRMQLVEKKELPKLPLPTALPSMAATTSGGVGGRGFFSGIICTDTTKTISDEYHISFVAGINSLMN